MNRPAAVPDGGHSRREESIIDIRDPHSDVHSEHGALPGERFVYSDINFFLLGDIIRRVTGERLDAYATKHVFEPLGMKDTSFYP